MAACNRDSARLDRIGTVAALIWVKGKANAPRTSSRALPAALLRLVPGAGRADAQEVLGVVGGADHTCQLEMGNGQRDIRTSRISCSLILDIRMSPHLCPAPVARRSRRPGRPGFRSSSLMNSPALASRRTSDCMISDI